MAMYETSPHPSPVKRKQKKVASIFEFALSVGIFPHSEKTHQGQNKFGVNPRKIFKLQFKGKKKSLRKIS